MSKSNNVNNGRVTFTEPNLCNLFAMYDKIPAKQCVTYRGNPTEGIWEETPMSRAYFSKANRQIIQNAIRAAVNRMSNGQYVIAEQDCTELEIVQRSIFLQNSRNLPDDIPGQIAALNQMVVDYFAPLLYSEAKQYIHYRKDVSSLAVPLATPVVARQYDRLEHPAKTWF